MKTSGRKTNTKTEKKKDNLFESYASDAEIWIDSKTTENRDYRNSGKKFGRKQKQERTRKKTIYLKAMSQTQRYGSTQRQQK